MEPLPKPFLNSVKGKLDADVRAGFESEWLPPLKAATRQLNLSEEETAAVVVDVRKYADTIDPAHLSRIPREKALPYLLRAIWKTHVGSRESGILNKSSKDEDEGNHEDSASGGQGDNNLKDPDDKSAETEAEGEKEKIATKCKLLLDKVAPFFLDKRPEHEDFDCTANVLDGSGSGNKKKFSRYLWRYVINHMEPEYRLPTLILKKHQYLKREEPRNLGPGCYDPYDYEIKQKARLKSTRGAMYSCTPRFAREYVKKDSPDPGAYGNPYDKLKRSGLASAGKVPLFQSGPCDVRGKTFKLVGSSLGPGDYEAKSSIQELLSKRISGRGPYDLFSQPSRFDIIHGYFKRPKLELEPGMYGDYGGLKELLHGRNNVNKGKLSKMSRDQKYTGERITLTHPLWPSPEMEKLPGPGHYHIKDMPEFSRTCWGENFWAFNLSTEARPELPADYDNAPTRYRPELSLNFCPLGSGFPSNFKSTSTRLNYSKSKVMSERLRAKDIPPGEKHAALADECRWFK